MRTATILMTALLLGAPVWVGAQAARPTTSTPETFSATAQAKNATGAVSGTLEVRLNRYTPDFDRKTVEEALRLGGYPRFRHDPSERARSRATRARRRPAVRDPVCARESRGRWPDDRRGDRQARVLSRRRASQTPSREPDTKWPCSRFSWMERDRGTGRWRLPRACAPMATAACCSMTTPRSPSR